jgi:hypothetical protein
MWLPWFNLLCYGFFSYLIILISSNYWHLTAKRENKLNHLSKFGVCHLPYKLEHLIQREMVEAIISALKGELAATAVNAPLF